MRKPIIAGNWKMNNTVAEALTLVNGLKPLVKDAVCDVVVCVPFVCIPAVKEALKDSKIGLGAQNMHWIEKGAYTGEISPGQLVDLGVQYVILGHSERRQYFAETDETVNQKVKAAFNYGLTPIVCVGETLAQREEGITNELVRNQTVRALEGLSNQQVENTIIAYEPIWAIGTGRTATSDDANAVIGVIRHAIQEVFGIETAQKVRIQYGGSMNASNATELMNMPEIDGGLVGGASLKAEEFSKVVNY